MQTTPHPFRSALIRAFKLVTLVGIITACSQPPQGLIDSEEVRLIPPTVTPTTTATPTATPTAPALALTDARPEIPQIPNPLGLAVRCGVADYFDYPLDPPDAEIVSGGQDFGVYRQRYEGYHTGEDWWYERRGSLGKPVYSVGNGRVRYAAPNGWGDDLGTLVLEHILPDGRRQHSFYGHIDPDSLTLRVGRCVARGEQVGLIGDPRSSPHLHFEIRTIFADSPGPGYWSIDPARSGWLPPSQTIEFSRYRADQRVPWWRALESTHTRSLGWLTQDVLLFQEDSDLVAIELPGGLELLRYRMEDPVIHAALGSGAGLLYLVDNLGSLHAMSIEVAAPSSPRQVSVGGVLWSAAMEDVGIVGLLPFEGGVIVLGRESWSAYSMVGRRLWRVEAEAALSRWILLGEGVMAISREDVENLWTMNRDGVTAWGVTTGGALFQVEGLPYLYTPGGLFRLDRETRGLQELISWSGAQLDQASVVGLMGGDLLLLQRDRFDHRLMRLDARGTMIWERSLTPLEADHASLASCGGDTWLLTDEELRSSVKSRLYRLEDGGNVEEVFQTHIRESFLGRSEASCAHGATLLLALGGRRQLLIEPVPTSEP